MSSSLDWHSFFPAHSTKVQSSWINFALMSVLGGRSAANRVDSAPSSGVLKNNNLTETPACDCRDATSLLPVPCTTAHASLHQARMDVVDHDILGGILVELSLLDDGECTEAHFGCTIGTVGPALFFMLPCLGNLHKLFHIPEINVTLFILQKQFKVNSVFNLPHQLMEQI